MSCQCITVGDGLNICAGSHFVFFSSSFKVKNSENLLQVQTVFRPAEKRTGGCMLTLAFTHITLCTSVHSSAQSLCCCE